VIPARNEARNLAWVLEQVPSCVDEVILVDGDSTDATPLMARSCRPDIRIVSQDRPGKGSALRAGFQAATSEVVVMMDADGSMSPQEIPRFLYFLDNRLRRLGNRSLLTLVNLLTDSRLTDLCYGFCAFRRRYLEHLGLSASGFEIETELVLGALRAGLRIAEVPSLELPRRSGRSRLRTFRDGDRVLRTVLRHRFTDGEPPGPRRLAMGEAEA
jgi:glycosyltransferase involved in cell wall biosynthesis